jgi:thiol-disulfide isomerase/thioredoxin
MGKAGTPQNLRQRKANDHNVAMEEEDDDDFLLNAPSLGATKQRWLRAIQVLVMINVPMGCIHVGRGLGWHRQTGVQVNTLVKSLSDESLSSHVASHPNGTLVNFHSPGCKFCETLAPEYEAVAKELLHIGSSTSLVSVSASAAPLFVKRYSVTKFPTILWFRRGELVQDVPPSVRTRDKLLEYVDNALQPAVVDDFASRDMFEESVPQLRAVLKGGLPLFVGYGGTSGVYESLVRAGERFRGLTAFLFVKEGRTGDPLLRALFANASADVDYNGGLGSQDIQAWMQPLIEATKAKSLLPSH